jgi:RNA polymerase sigma-70 factor (ECF subfamily)
MRLDDPTDFARVYDQHARAVYGTALRVLGNSATAQDVAQDVFLRVWRNPAKFDAKRGDLGAYLRLMARSRALDVYREGQAAGRAGDRLKVVVASEPAHDESSRPAERLEHDEDREVVREALRLLPDAQREAVVLAYWGGLTAEEVSRRVGVPLGTAKSRIRLGLARLRDACAEPEAGLEALAA